MTTVALERLDLLCELERWAEAAALSGRLLSTEPDDDTVWCVLARCRLGLGQPEAALDAAWRATALAPESEWPYRLASFASSQLGRHDDAVHAAREAVRLEPGLWQTHARLAGAAGQHPRGAQEAVRAADQALALAPDEPQAQLIYGSVAAGQGRHQQAERAFRSVLELDPQNAGAHHLLASVHLRRLTGGPAALADAATGFATALSTDPTAEISRQSLEQTLRLFLGRTAYFLFIASYLGLLFADRSTPAARAVPVLLVMLPILFVAGFVNRLSPALRRFLQRLLARPRLTVAAGLEVCCVVLVTAGAFASQPVHAGLAIAAPVTALVARLIVYLAGPRSGRCVGGSPS
jgi:tetratricopeptide (TPR) repeat protein